MMIASLKNWFSRAYTSIQYAVELQGMLRAAEEMYRLGYYKEYEATMKRVREMRS